MKPKRMFRSFTKNAKKRSVLLYRTEKNAKIVPLFYKERKRTQRSFRSFIKNGKERKDRSVLLKRMDAQPCCMYNCTYIYTEKKRKQGRAETAMFYIGNRAKG